ncbi:MAG TPA: metallophosphoesterase [Candidatus Nanoarchaeia archaeon]|nr:metallophosphoesterase [Candidatus Nanoarchaeia archaeon]
MEIAKGIEIIDLCLYLKKEDILVISDTHIGYEEALNKQGILIPRFQFKEIIERLEGALFKVTKIVINGDVKHEFGNISDQEWRHTLRLLDFLSRYCDEVILVKGNHDTILGPIAEKRKIRVVDELRVGDVLIAHGDKIPKDISEVKTIITGHEHPAISISDGVRFELFKCYLKGRWKGKILIVQPSFNLVTEGTDILKERLLSPMLKGDISEFEVFVVDKEVFDFGKIGKLT